MLPHTMTDLVQVPNVSELFTTSVTRQLFGSVESRLAA